MVKLNNQAFAQQPNQQTSFNQTPSQFSEQARQQNPLNNQTPKGLEMLTGQKIPPTGVLADILSGIQQMQFSLNQVLNQQQQI
ncbi:15120_t:CDS:2 [Funneliformis geosporum]|uniref:15120_t:CDS:1 n=1 Tax=Funneliformis geosporum TaxID=1117311 RepID=A0A9W4X2W5_9GLOM|nr:15120_t:CDS:2 [Funneliformis geosporum]